MLKQASAPAMLNGDVIAVICRPAVAAKGSVVQLFLQQWVAWAREARARWAWEQAAAVEASPAVVLRAYRVARARA
jgi:hypothetical protein